MKHMFLIAFLLGASACVLPSPKIDLPAPYEQDGLQISVDGFYKIGTSYVGLTGTAQNVSGKDLTMCSITFDIVDSMGAKVGDAIANTQGLRAGQEWRFQALFTTAFATTFKGIRSGRVTVLGTTEDMIAEMHAKANSGASSAPVVGASSRAMGVLCDERLPSGDVLPRVTRIVPGSLADRSGWKSGDLILAVDETEVRTLTDVVVLTQQGSRTKTYTLQRKEEVIKSTVTFPSSK